MLERIPVAGFSLFPYFYRNMQMKCNNFFYLIVIISSASCNNNGSAERDSNGMPTIPVPINLSYTIVAQHPKDTSAYTQGLEIYQGKLYESTGDWGNSSLRIIDLKTGNVAKKHVMGTDKIFGEGITILNNKIYQLTWLSNIVYVYDINDITKPIQILKWPHEGWGITNNGKDLIISDGSDHLYFADPADLTIRKTLPVLSYKGPITALNELEYIDGYVFANVYQQDYIVKIDLVNGQVIAVMIMDNLLQSNEKIAGRTDVLNGIAYDSATKTMLITGKRWPKIFEVKLN